MRIERQTLWMASEQDQRLMREAIRLMREVGVISQTGGPFGAVIAKDGRMIAAAGNSVVQDLDPSAHAEVNAIRAACQALGTWDLSGCVLYTSCECCPMCYATAYWAGIRKIFYAAAWSDYSDLFADQEIHDDMQEKRDHRAIHCTQILQEEASAVWTEFRLLPDGVRY
jgi:tRNA(Arg) A34 adenosine deaminase TadA